MKRLTVENMGEAVQGVYLQGDRKNPEPESFRVVFPGGDVDVVRTTDEQYWVHIRVNRPEDCVIEECGRVPGRLVDARLDIVGKAARETNAGDFADERLYHLAVRVAPASLPQRKPRVTPPAQRDLFEQPAEAAR